VEIVPLFTTILSNYVLVVYICSFHCKFYF